MFCAFYLLSAIVSFFVKEDLRRTNHADDDNFEKKNDIDQEREENKATKNALN